MCGMAQVTGQTKRPRTVEKRQYLVNCRLGGKTCSSVTELMCRHCLFHHSPFSFLTRLVPHYGKNKERERETERRLAQEARAHGSTASLDTKHASFSSAPRTMPAWPVARRPSPIARRPSSTHQQGSAHSARLRPVLPKDMVGHGVLASACQASLGTGLCWGQKDRTFIVLIR